MLELGILYHSTVHSEAKLRMKHVHGYVYNVKQHQLKNLTTCKKSAVSCLNSEFEYDNEDVLLFTITKSQN